MTSPNLTIAVRTLIAGGFELEAVDRHPGYALIRISRFDEFGASHRYVFALAENSGLSEVEVEGALVAAKHLQSELVVIGETLGSRAVPSIPWLKFVNLFGGPVTSGSPLDPEFGNQLIELGHNSLPNDLVGTPDDLFEIYVRTAFEFILAGRVIRYGQSRRFERRPDGLAIAGVRITALYDAKAYSNGYPVTVESVRQFGDYIEEFQGRYGPFLGRINSFIVVSGRFVQGEDALRDRSAEMVAKLGVPLSFLTAVELSKMIAFLAEAPRARQAIDWPRVFSQAAPSAAAVRSEIDAIAKDQVIPGVG